MRIMNKEDLLEELKNVYKTGFSMTRRAAPDVEELSDFLNIRNEWYIPRPEKALIGWEDQDFSHSYIESFYRIADLGVRNKKEGIEDYLIYSIMFNYKHYIELTLKGLILNFQLSFGREIIHANTHNLINLMYQLKQLLNEISLDELIPEGIENSITEFQEIDSTSTGFRFNYQTDGSQSFDYSAKYFDLDKIRQGIEIIYEWFKAIFISFDEGYLGTPYVVSPSLKAFSKRVSNYLNGKSKNQIENILKKIKFDLSRGDISQDENIEKKLFFDTTTIKDNNEDSIVVYTNNDLSYKIKYNNDNKIISVSTYGHIIGVQ